MWNVITLPLPNFSGAIEVKLGLESVIKFYVYVIIHALIPMII